MSVKKCRSKTVPCPAGDRCPAHRGRAEAIMKALGDADLPVSDLFKKDELTREDAVKVNEFFKGSKLKSKKDGSTVITVNRKQEVARRRVGSTEVSFFKTKAEKIVVPAVHPADAVDKTHRIVPTREDNGAKKTFDVGMQESLDALYDGNVSVTTNSTFDVVQVESLDVTDEYKGHGVESHVLASVVLDRRPDLYDAVSKADVPYEEHVKAGFEPNPYYWAGKTHPVSGVVYPEVAVLDGFAEGRENPAYVEGSYYNLRTAKSNQGYPYMRMKHGWTYSGTPWKQGEFTKEERKQANELRNDKWDRTEMARAVWNPLDLH